MLSQNMTSLFYSTLSSVLCLLRVAAGETWVDGVSVRKTNINIYKKERSMTSTWFTTMFYTHECEGLLFLTRWSRCKNVVFITQWYILSKVCVYSSALEQILDEHGQVNWAVGVYLVSFIIIVNWTLLQVWIESSSDPIQCRTSVCDTITWTRSPFQRVLCKP